MVTDYEVLIMFDPEAADTRQSELVERLKGIVEGLRHAAACPAPSHAACPSFQRLLKAAATGALEKRPRRLAPRGSARPA